MERRYKLHDHGWRGPGHAAKPGRKLRPVASRRGGFKLSEPTLAEIDGISSPTPLNEWPDELLAVRSEALQCRQCSIAERRRNVVFGEGNPKSPLVLVGEGPGDTEDATGRPFVGKAGKLLDKALAENGLSRCDVYICNTVKCRACDWSTGKPVNRPPTDEETQNCRTWLIPQLRIIAPKVILCVGAPSAKNLIKKDFKITQERGKYFPTDLAKTAIATLHPAYILRQMNISGDGGYSLLVADIARAWQAAQKLVEKDLAESMPVVSEPEQTASLF